MTGLNHALTGGAIGLALPLPVALPLALASHFILDMIPHYGIDDEKRNEEKFYRAYVTVDTVFTICLAIYVIATRPEAGIILGPLLATIPDYEWVYRTVKERNYNLKKNTKFSKWHSKIQREYPWGLWVEIPFTIIMSYLVFVVLW